MSVKFPFQVGHSVFLENKPLSSWLDLYLWCCGNEPFWFLQYFNTKLSTLSTWTLDLFFLFRTVWTTFLLLLVLLIEEIIKSNFVNILHVFVHSTPNVERKCFLFAVAMQCLESAYGINTSEPESAAKYHVDKNLLDIFNSHINTEVRRKILFQSVFSFLTYFFNYFLPISASKFYWHVSILLFLWSNKL